MTAEPGLPGRPVAGPASQGPGPLRRRLTDPLGPAVLLAAVALLAAAHREPLTWAVIGGLAGYTLSGSV